jgi:metal-responsive CopG/Arc/MetJ family transcriptional regulator
MNHEPTVKVAISLPAGLYRTVERARKRRGQNRSEFFRDAVREALGRARERDADARYVQAYVDQPESTDEISRAQEIAKDALFESPW